ncbi:MAG: di-heme oxidoredictase family protein [Pseudomonadota bacterium]
MPNITHRHVFAAAAVASLSMFAWADQIGDERSVPRHLEDGDEFRLHPRALVAHGQVLFDARWTTEDGGGRPQTTGTGKALADPTAPLEFPRNFNRISGPDANSCAGCHNQPRSGGAGEQVANVFVLGQRFDFATFDSADFTPTRGNVDEWQRPTTLQSIANERNTVGMFGAGYVEMLARQFTVEFQAYRDSLQPGESVALVSQGIDFGTLKRDAHGNWDTAGVTSLPAPSLASSGPNDPPSLVVRPFHQAAAVVSLREFTNNAMNHHHGIQTTERFGTGDPDADGYTAEMTRADVTAVSLYQATLAVPGRVIPRNRKIEAAVRTGERVFEKIGCDGCHTPTLKLEKRGWIYSEPNPFNPPGNLQVGESPELAVNLNSPLYDLPRLRRRGRVVEVPAYTDFRLHNITSGPDDPNCEPLNMHFPAGSAEFFAGNCRFLSSRLWGVADAGPYMHHGKYTTMREAIEAHAGEAQATTDAWHGLTEYERDSVIEFLKTLRILPEGTRFRIVDEYNRPRRWPKH